MKLFSFCIRALTQGFNALRLQYINSHLTLICLNSPCKQALGGLVFFLSCVTVHFITKWKVLKKTTCSDFSLSCSTVTSLLWITAELLPLIKFACFFFRFTTAITEWLKISKAWSLSRDDRGWLVQTTGQVWRDTWRLTAELRATQDYLQLSSEIAPRNIFSPSSMDFFLIRNSQRASSNLTIMPVVWERKWEKLLPSPWLLWGETNLSPFLSPFSSIPCFYLRAVGEPHITILKPSQLEQTKPEWGGRWWRLRQCIFSHFDELWRREVDNLLKKGNGGLYVNVFRWIINVAF